MKLKSATQENEPFFFRYSYALLIGFSFLLWLFCFRGFILNRLVVFSDAQAYYEHFKFFIDSFQRGVYPLWDPTRNFGMPNELFLRRIGSFNPFFVLIIIFHKIGIPYTSAYFLFLSSYFFVGLAGFYLLAKRIFRDRQLAFVAFLLLMFSSLGTRLFDSYILLSIIPMIWFYYFLVRFTQDYDRLSLLGLTFSLMVILTTYLPFYFVTILFLFLLSYVVLYFSGFRLILARTGTFFLKDKIFTIICVFLVILSIIPGLLFFFQASDGELSLPARHYKSEAQNVMAVDVGTVTGWGITEDVMFSSAYLSDLKKFKFAVLYTPLFAWIVFFLALFVKVSRRLLFFFLWGLSIFMITSHHLPVYHFMREHLFYFVYFRNLHFFLWIILLPIFVLFLVEQFRLICDNLGQFTKQRKVLFMSYALLVHAGWCLYLIYRVKPIATSYIVLGLSCLFFTLCLSGRIRMGGRGVPLFLFALIVLEPMQVFHYLQVNRETYQTVYPVRFMYRYHNDYLDFVLPTLAHNNLRREKKFAAGQNTSVSLLKARPIEAAEEGEDSGIPMEHYAGVSWSLNLFNRMKSQYFYEYVYNKLLVYDRIESMSYSEETLARLAKSLVQEENLAFVSSSDQSVVERALKEMESGVSRQDNAPLVEVVTEDSIDVKVMRYGVNSLELKTSFPSKKFLVYNDSYHSDWQVFINGVGADLLRSNAAFKGLWVPAGEQIVQFRFGPSWQRLVNSFMLAVFYLTFFCLIRLGYCTWKARYSAQRLSLS